MSENTGIVDELRRGHMQVTGELRHINELLDRQNRAANEIERLQKERDSSEAAVVLMAKALQDAAGSLEYAYRHVDSSTADRVKRELLPRIRVLTSTCRATPSAGLVEVLEQAAQVAHAFVDTKTKAAHGLGALVVAGEIEAAIRALIPPSLAPAPAGGMSRALELAIGRIELLSSLIREDHGSDHPAATNHVLNECRTALVQEEKVERNAERVRVALAKLLNLMERADGSLRVEFRHGGIPDAFLEARTALVQNKPQPGPEKLSPEPRNKAGLSFPQEDAT